MHMNVRLFKLFTVTLYELWLNVNVLYALQVKEMIIEHPAIHIDILQSTVNVSLRMTYEFTTLSVNELVEVINYEMTLTTLGNFSVTSVPQLSIFESTGM